MAIGDIVVCLDVGASKVSCVVAQVNKFNQIEVLGVGSYANSGLKKGIIYDSDITSNAIKESIKEAEHSSGLVIKSAYVNIKGMNVRIERLRVHGKVERPDEGLTYNDIYNLYEKMQTSVEYDNKEKVIDIIPFCYYLNDRKYNDEPIGAYCKQFTIDGDIVLGKSEYIDSLVQSMNKAGLKIDGLILETLATSNVVLIPEEKELGVLLLDIGASHTEISIYYNNRLEFYTTLPVGSDYITNDIALSLGITYDEAEKLKRQYNLAMELMINHNHEVKLNTVKDNDRPNIVRCSDIVKVIESRMIEINTVIRNILLQNRLLEKIQCVVITGQGVTNISGIEERAALDLKINQIRISVPKLISTVKPNHITAYGLAKQVSILGLSKHVNSNVEIVTEPTIKEKFFSKFFRTKEKIKKINGEENIED